MKIASAIAVLAALIASPAFAHNATIPANEIRTAEIRPLSSPTQQPGQLQAKSFRGDRMVQYCVPPEEDADDTKLFCRSGS